MGDEVERAGVLRVLRGGEGFGGGYWSVENEASQSSEYLSCALPNGPLV